MTSRGAGRRREAAGGEPRGRGKGRAIFNVTVGVRASREAEDIYWAAPKGIGLSVMNVTTLAVIELWTKALRPPYIGGRIVAVEQSVSSVETPLEERSSDSPDVASQAKHSYSPRVEAILRAQSMNPLVKFEFSVLSNHRSQGAVAGSIIAMLLLATTLVGCAIPVVGNSPEERRHREGLPENVQPPQP